MTARPAKGAPVTESHRNVVHKYRECLSCGVQLGRRRPGYCSSACRQAAYRARRRGDLQALFDRWIVLLYPVLRFKRVREEAMEIERTMWIKHGANPHKLLEEIHATRSARRRAK